MPALNTTRWFVSLVISASLAACGGGGGGGGGDGGNGNGGGSGGPANQPLAADAGPDQTVAPGTPVTLDGSGSSDSDGSVSSYQWTQTGGPNVSLSNPSSANPGFDAPNVDATLTFSLVVTDDDGRDSSSDTVSVSITGSNSAPVADAGANQTVNEGATVTLSGSGSDADGSISSFAWTQTAGPGVALSDASAANPTFPAPLVDSDTVLSFSLSVTDNDGASSAPDTVDVTVEDVPAGPGNQAPTAVATGPGSLDEQMSGLLDGTGSSDSDGSVVAWAWTQTDATGFMASIQDPAAASTNVTMPILLVSDGAQDLVFSLVVTDDLGRQSVADTATVNVSPVNAAPDVSAGPDQNVLTDALVTLDGSSSNDSDGTIDTYAWNQTGGANVVLSSAGAANPTFTAPASADTLTFELQVTDNEGETSSVDSVTIDVIESAGLPFTDNFNDGNSNGWVEVDDRGAFPRPITEYMPIDWTVTGGAFRQRNRVAGRSNGAEGLSLSGTYLRGAYAYRPDTLGLTDYRFEVDITVLDNLPGNDLLRDSADGFGVMFRYQDNDSYYRLAFNGNQGNTRLEKKRAAVAFNASSGLEAFSTLAQDYRGHVRPGQTISVAVEVSDDLIQVFVDGDPLFAAQDDQFSSGGIGLYSRDAVSFDNVNVTLNSTGIVVADPVNHVVVPGGTQDVTVTAIAIGADTAGGDTVEISADAGLCGGGVAAETAPGSGVFTASCSGLTPGNHDIRADLRDSGAAIVASDLNDRVGVGAATGVNATSGNRYDAIGDSITMGQWDNYGADGIPPSADRRAISLRGWPATLQQMLEASTGQPTLIGNEGMPGSSLQGNPVPGTDPVVPNSLQARGRRELESVFERSEGANGALVMFGTNDSKDGHVDNSQNDPADNCSTGARGTNFEANYVQLLQRMQQEGRDQIYVAMIPPVFANSGGQPYTSNPGSKSRNACIQVLNNKIAFAVLPNGTLNQPQDTPPELGPDFYTCMLGAGENRYNLFEDVLHPNGLGYAYMANLWEDAILNGSTKGLCPDTGFFLLDGLAYDWDDNGINLNSTDVNIFQQNLLEVGDYYYVEDGGVQHRSDFTHTLTSVPPELDTADARWVMTGNQLGGVFRTDTRSNVLVFDVGSTGATVYVAYDGDGAPPTISCDSGPCSLGISSLSGNLRSTDLNVNGTGIFSVVDTGSVTGTIRLGGNHSGNTVSNASYIVIVIPD